MCVSLAEAGYAVTYLAHPAATDRLDPRIGFTSLGERGQVSLAWRLGDRLRRCLRAYQLALRSGADLFHFYAPEFIPWALRLRRVTRRPVIFDCMEDFEGYALQRRGLPQAARRPLALGVRTMLHHAARNLDAVVVADIGTGDLLRPAARRVELLHNFPQLAHFPDPGLDERERPYDLTYHGSIPRYHLEICFAIDAALLGRGQQVRWRFLGSMAERAWFESERARRGAQERFVFSGSVPHEQVATEVLKARLGIIPLPSLPKFQHNIPQKLFEFMALRMPVVLSDLPPSRPFVGDGACAVMVDPAEAHAYADAIMRLLGDPALCQRMGAEGRRRAEVAYNWERESRTLLQLYADLLS